MPTEPTPLARALANADESRATPLTAFKTARRWWLDGRRLNLSVLAKELGIGRATLMRWVGNKELLLGEILWSLYKDVLDQAEERARGEGLKGGDFLVHIYHNVNHTLMSAEPLRQFLAHDPKFSLQMLTSNAGGLQQRLISAWAKLIEEQIAAGHIAPQLPSQELAYFVIRIGEASIYSDLICERTPDLAAADTAFRLLLSGKVE